MAAVISSKVHLSAVSIRSSSTPRAHVLQDYLLQAGCSPGLSSLYIRKCGILGNNENVVPTYHYCSHVFCLCIPYFVSLSYGVDVFWFLPAHQGEDGLFMMFCISVVLLHSLCPECGASRAVCVYVCVCVCSIFRNPKWHLLWLQIICTEYLMSSMQQHIKFKFGCVVM